MDRLDVLKKDVVIPEIVRIKADEAFDKIKAETAENKRKSLRKRKRTVFIAVAAAAVLSVSAAAAYMNWSRGIDGMLNTDETQKGTAVQTGLADFPGVSAENGGVKITTQQSIVDNNYALISLKVDGVRIERGEEPRFENITLTVGGETVGYESGFGGSFTGGGDSDSAVGEDGSMEYMIMISANYEGQLVDKNAHIELENFGIYKDKTTLLKSVEGKWEMDWTLKGNESIYKAEIDKPVGNSGLTVKSVEISPISIKAVYDCPKQITYETVVDGATGEEETVESYLHPAELVGVGLKDGTLLTDITQGMGEAGYINDNEFAEKFAVNTILDADKIETVLIADLTGVTDVLTAEDVYYINIR